MERRIRSEKLLQTWRSVREKVRGIDSSIVDNVDKDLEDKSLETLAKGANLLEAIDFLHDSLQAKSTDLLPKVFNAYQSFCLAVLVQERDRDRKLTGILQECQVKVLNLKLPISRNVDALREAIDSFKKCSAALIKSAETLKTSERNRQLLLADQINISLGLLVKAVAEFEMDEKNSSKKIQSGIEYVLGRLLWCSRDLYQAEASECGQFLDVMDDVLDVLERQDSKPENVDELRAKCEILLSHAMSVAHVAMDADSQDIFYIGQKVLSRLDSLKKEQSPGLLSLQLGALADVLLQLEQIVNNALLKLVLEVFLDIDSSIGKLVGGAKTELDTRISDFDLYVDRVMQIGLFAIACSNDIKRVASVRSCLASLESLEPEFVPSIQAVDSGKGSDALVTFFENHWKEEARRLETLLDQLIDPAAFAQIVASQVALMQSSADQAPKLVLCASKLRSLISHLDADDLDLSSELIKKFDYYLAELKAALEQPPCEKWERRVVERARLLSKSVQVIAQELADHSETFISNRSETPTEDNGKIPTEDEIIPEESPPSLRNSTNMSFPESVRDLPIDITETLKGTNMEPFYVAGKKINQERNLLYKTPQQAKTPLSILRKTPGIAITHTPGVAKQLFPKDENDDEQPIDLDSTMDLNVTNILENLSGLEDTLNLFVGLEETMSTALEGFKRRRHKIGASVRSRKILSSVKKPGSSESAVMISPSIGSQGISLDEREHDLSFLQKKIEELKTDLELFGKSIDSCQQELF